MICNYFNSFFRIFLKNLATTSSDANSGISSQAINNSLNPVPVPPQHLSTNEHSARGQVQSQPLNLKSDNQIGTTSPLDPEFMAETRAEIICDGTGRIYDVHFDCPVKVS
ncbi:unnamed protein product [Protopolystoma xenopodis]|uniref:Uncharacterized protein n=1 Tax=Protopolystoma xenopodis TaxID=117903 RepID=A0A448WUM9_9PLAT|nr:unnamed protein product [Protopolystoma xenopodis]